MEAGGFVAGPHDHFAMIGADFAANPQDIKDSTGPPPWCMALRRGEITEERCGGWSREDGDALCY